MNSVDSTFRLSSLDCGIAQLRAWQPDDLESLVANANDADVARTLRDRFPHPYSESDGRDWLAHTCASENEEDALERTWAIEIDNAAVGGISLRRGRDVHRHTAEVGYWLGRGYWNRGVMTRVLSVFADHAMPVFRLHRLFASIYSNNPASGRVLEKAGFAREGVQRSAVVKYGELLDLIVYARVRAMLEDCA